MPLNFLDNKIRCGDSIVGLARIEELQKGIATEAFKTLPGDDKVIAATFKKQNKTERENRSQLKLTDTEGIIENLNSISDRFKKFNSLPDTTVNEVKKKKQEFNLLKGNEWMKLKELADVQVAQFFHDKTSANKEFLTTDAEYFRIFAGQKKEVNTRKVSQSMAVAVDKKFFHWFLEFPEVMQEGGFDSILGNPPYLGGKKISGTFSKNYLGTIHNLFEGITGQSDLITYFLRRIYTLIKAHGFLSLITTNSLAEGDTRTGGLMKILEDSGKINFAIKSVKWPGTANLNVSLLSICKEKTTPNIILNNKNVGFISSYLDDQVELNPKVLYSNREKMFRGVDFGGEGFIIDKNFKENILRRNPFENEVIYPLLNGEMINNQPSLQFDKYIINFFDWPLKRMDVDEWEKLTDEEKKEKIKIGLQSPNYNEPVAYDYPLSLNIIEKNVKPFRQRTKINKKGNEVFVMRWPLPYRWWIYAEKRPGLNQKIQNNDICVITSFTAKHLAFTITKTESVFTNALNILAEFEEEWLCILMSFIHEAWARKYASSLETRLRYTPSDVFETFPFPQNLTKETEEELEKIGEEYHEFRRRLMLDLQLGLTKTYNLFHNPQCSMQNVQLAEDIREFKQAHLQIPIEEAIKKIEKLRELHKQMDEAVLNAYNWTDIDLAHNFYEVDYLPENDRVRYTISPEARKEVLKRLLELNHKIHEEEVKAGLWDKKKGKKKGKSKKAKVDKAQGGLFGE